MQRFVKLTSTLVNTEKFYKEIQYKQVNGLGYT